MQQKMVTVLIDENGNSSIDLEGFGGHGCEKVLNDFRGQDRANFERRKPTYYASTNVAQDKLRSSGQ